MPLQHGHTHEGRESQPLPPRQMGSCQETPTPRDMEEEERYRERRCWCLSVTSQPAGNGGEPMTRNLFPVRDEGACTCSRPYLSGSTVEKALVCGPSRVPGWKSINPIKSGKMTLVLSEFMLLAPGQQQLLSKPARPRSSRCADYMQA